MKKFSKLSIIIFIFLLVSVFYPLAVMLSKVEWANFSDLVTSNAFRESLLNSLYVTVIATIIVMIISYLLAFALNRTNIKHRAILKVLLTVPMLIPSISHGLGLINLFGANGLISKIFGFNIIGSTGIIIGSILYSFPVAFLMQDDGFNYVDNSMYDIAKVIGMNKFETFKKVTFIKYEKYYVYEFEIDQISIGVCKSDECLDCVIKCFINAETRIIDYAETITDDYTEIYKINLDNNKLDEENQKYNDKVIKYLK